MKKVILITGASSGIGFESAKLLASQGHTVYGGARRLEMMNPLKEFGVTPLSLDVTDNQSMENVVNTIIKSEGRIDVLINNAGYGSYGPIEVVPMEEARRQIEVNVFGLAKMCQLVLPYMREQKSGHIINVSSVGGLVTSYLGGWYHASKYAVEALSHSIRMDTSDFGINVSTINPAGVASEWGVITADNLDKVGLGTAYEAATSKMANMYRTMYSKKNMMVGGSDKAAKVIAKAVNTKKPKARYLFGMGAKPMVFMSYILPVKAFNWMMKNTLG